MFGGASPRADLIVCRLGMAVSERKTLYPNGGLVPRHTFFDRGGMINACYRSSKNHLCIYDFVLCSYEQSLLVDYS